MGLHLRRRLSATPRYGAARPARRRYRCHVHASGRNRPPCRAGSACCAHHRWCRLSRRGAPRRSIQHHAGPPAALRSRAQSHGECLGIPARQQTRQHRVRKLRQHRRQILYRVELLRRRFRTRRFNHIQSLGDGQSLRPLVLERPKWDSLLRRRAARLKAEEIARQAKAQVESQRRLLIKSLKPPKQSDIALNAKSICDTQNAYDKGREELSEAWILKYQDLPDDVAEAWDIYHRTEGNPEIRLRARTPSTNDFPADPTKIKNGLEDPEYQKFQHYSAAILQQLERLASSNFVKCIASARFTRLRNRASSRRVSRKTRHYNLPLF